VDGRAVVRVHECSASGGDDDVTHREQELQNVALERPEIRFPALREDLRNRPAFARLDELVDVLGPPAQAIGQGSSHGSLASRHEPDEIDLSAVPREPRELVENLDTIHRQTRRR
jgi:hypothetical protein